jgi:hypothetical protein
VETMRSQYRPGRALFGKGTITSPAIDGPGRRWWFLAQF